MASTSGIHNARSHRRPSKIRAWAMLTSLVLLNLSFSSAQGPEGGSEAQQPEDNTGWYEPIYLDRSGGFPIGGRIMESPNNTNQTLSCDHGYMEYFIPWEPRRTSLVMWHSSSTQVWQNRWDGGGGFKDMFLRKDYPVYLWDGPRVGRANWGCTSQSYRPSYRDQGNWVGWNFGPRFGTWWPNIRFPTWDDAAWLQATASRYQEFDNTESVELQSDAAAIAADTGRIGNSIVYLTNSAAGLRAQLTVTKAKRRNIKGIVAYESMGFVFPDNEEGIRNSRGGFGPYVVPLADFKKLARLPGIQFIWGDNRPESHEYVKQSRRCAELINKYGGNAEVVMLGKDAGLTGSTHIPFADLGNEEVGELLEDFLWENNLDDYE